MPRQSKGESCFGVQADEIHLLIIQDMLARDFFNEARQVPKEPKPSLPWIASLSSRKHIRAIKRQIFRSSNATRLCGKQFAA